MSLARVEVVVAVCRHPDQRVLLSQRAATAHLGGLWEFPGGKVGAQETLSHALMRELDEELGLQLDAPVQWLMQRHYHYPDRDVHLHVAELRLSTEQVAQVRSREGQPLAWCALSDPRFDQMPAANAPILAALRWPAWWAISPDSADLGQLQQWLLAHCVAAPAERLGLVLRAPQLSWTAYAELAAWCLPQAADAGLPLLLHGHRQALEHFPQAAGLHLPYALWHDSWQRGEQRAHWLAQGWCQPQHLLAAAAHNEQDLAQLLEFGVDWAWLSPVNATASHPGQAGMGWPTWQQLACATPLPVAALGGLKPDDLAQARQHGGFAVAGIRGF